ncbi:hypothetical protein EV426DRAFT_701275 [Tirmania nivea]|nr:hypothetical protein EV426DRAFT_701275 [Tirmania nivea]
MSSIFQLLFRPQRFSGEGDTVCVEDFVDILRFSFMGLDPAMEERAKVLTLQSYLDRKAKQYWMTLKATFEIAAGVLTQRFTRPVDDLDEWGEKSQAIRDLNNLSQGALTCEKYIERANRISATLGTEYSSVLATKFVDGLVDDFVKLLINSQFEADYTFPEVIRVYAKATRFNRRKEEVAQQREKKKEVVKTEMELMMETFCFDFVLISGTREWRWIDGGVLILPFSNLLRG